MWAILSTIVIVVGCQSEPPPDLSIETNPKPDSGVVDAKQTKTSKVISSNVWKTEELLDRLAVGMPITDVVYKGGFLAEKGGSLPFSAPYQITVITESSDSNGSTIEEILVLFFYRTKEMPPSELDSPDELKLTAVAKRLRSDHAAERPVLTYVMPEALKGKECTGCALIDPE